MFEGRAVDGVIPQVSSGVQIIVQNMHSTCTYKHVKLREGAWSLDPSSESGAPEMKKYWYSNVEKS